MNREVFRRTVRVWMLAGAAVALLQLVRLNPQSAAAHHLLLIAAAGGASMSAWLARHGRPLSSRAMPIPVGLAWAAACALGTIASRYAGNMPMGWKASDLSDMVGACATVSVGMMMTSAMASGESIGAIARGIFVGVVSVPATIIGYFAFALSAVYLGLLLSACGPASPPTVAIMLATAGAVSGGVTGVLCEGVLFFVCPESSRRRA